MEFHATAAQVIPLIFVAIAFEARTVWSLSSWYRFGYAKEDVFWIRIFLVIVPTFILIIGETAALWALAHDTEPRFEAGYPGWLIAGALYVGSFSLFLHFGLQIAFETDDQTVDRRSLKFVLLPSVLGLAIAFSWIAVQIVQALNN